MSYEHSAITEFKSAISTYHDPINRIPIGIESWILLEFQLGKNRWYPLFWQVFIILDLQKLGTHLFGMSRKLLSSSQL